MSSSRGQVALAIAGAVASSLVCGAADAAEPPSDQAPARPPEAAKQAESPIKPKRQGLQLGPLSVNPAITVSEGFDDNVFSTRNRKVDDFLTVVAPRVDVEASGSDFEVKLNAGAEIGRYRENDRENYDDYFVGGEGRYRFSPDSSVFGGLTYAYDHEERESPNDVNGLEPTIYDDVQAFLGAANRFGLINTRLGVTFQRLDFDDVVAAGGGQINNDDRDRDQFTAGGRFGYQLTPRHEVFGQVAADVRDYSSRVDDLGLDRDSDGYSAAIGLRYERDRTFEAEVLGGYMAQDYDDRQLKTIGAWDASALLNWRVAPNTTLKGFFDRTIEETTVFASGYVNTGLGASVERLIRPDLSAEIGLAHYDSDYYGNGRKDEVVIYTLGGRYYLTPNFFTGVDFRHVERDSNDPGEDYNDNLLLLRLGAELAPGYDAATLASPGVPEGIAGFYGGAQGSFGKLGVELQGDRGPVGGGGALTADFGNHGFGGGAFLGYGAAFGPAYLALELTGDASEANWGHVRSPEGRIFGVHKGKSVSLGPLAGYLLPGGMVFGRFDVVGAELDTEYSEAGAVFDEDHVLKGLRFGVGAEAPVSGGMFLRMDYTHTAYEDYIVPSRMGRLDNFANDESMVRAGFGYRFGAAQARSNEPNFVADFNGPYIGANFGHGAIGTRLQGPREEGGAGGALDADYADDGVTGGAFAGYGQTFGAFFIAAEVEAELSDHNFDLDRQGGGRQVQLEKQDSYGAALRLGLVVQQAALVYARVGAVATEFQIDYATGGGRTLAQQERLLGVRFGGGLELPATEDIFVRLDYTYTDYEGDDIAFGGMGQTDLFDSAESLFRLGVGYRF